MEIKLFRNNKLYTVSSMNKRAQENDIVTQYQNLRENYNTNKEHINWSLTKHRGNDNINQSLKAYFDNSYLLYLNKDEFKKIVNSIYSNKDIRQKFEESGTTDVDEYNTQIDALFEDNSITDINGLDQAIKNINNQMPGIYHYYLKEYRPKLIQTDNYVEKHWGLPNLLKIINNDKIALNYVKKFRPHMYEHAQNIAKIGNVKDNDGYSFRQKLNQAFKDGNFNTQGTEYQKLLTQYKSKLVPTTASQNKNQKHVYAQISNADMQQIHNIVLQQLPNYDLFAQNVESVLKNGYDAYIQQVQNNPPAFDYGKIFEQINNFMRELDSAKAEINRSFQNAFNNKNFGELNNFKNTIEKYFYVDIKIPSQEELANMSPDKAGNIAKQQLAHNKNNIKTSQSEQNMFIPAIKKMPPPVI